MRILHVVDSVFKAGGGTSEVVPRLCEALVSAGNEVRLVTCPGDIPSDATIRAMNKGVDVRFCAAKHIKGLSFLRVTKEFKREIRDGVLWADVVHVHGHWQDPTWTAMFFAIKCKKPYVVQPHGFLSPERLEISKWKKKFVAFAVEKPFLRRADRIIATAESERDGILKFVSETEIDIVPIGFDFDYINEASVNKSIITELGLSDRKKTILYFSRITPIKGLDILAEAWQSLGCKNKDWQLLIVGPDDRGYTNEAKHLFKDCILDGSVAFHGPIYGSRKYELLKTVDAFVLPTRSENWSIAVQEALAAGLPVICTKGAPWSGIEGGEDWGKCGWWVDISVDAIADGLAKCMALSMHEIAMMSLEAKKFIKIRFDWKNVAKQQISIYNSVLSKTMKE